MMNTMLDSVTFWLDLRRVRIKKWIRDLPHLAKNLVRAIQGNWLFDANRMPYRASRRIRIFLDHEDVTDIANQAFCSVYRAQSRLGWVRCIQLDENDRITMDEAGEPVFVERTGVVCWVLNK